MDDLNARFDGNRTVDKCMHKIKYRIDKYKEKTDWNRKQSGGNLKKSPFYDEIDEVLRCRDFVTFNNVKRRVQCLHPTLPLPRLVQMQAAVLHHLRKDLSQIAMSPITKNHRTVSERNEGSARKGEIQQPNKRTAR